MTDAEALKPQRPAACYRAGERTRPDRMDTTRNAQTRNSLAVHDIRKTSVLSWKRILRMIALTAAQTALLLAVLWLIVMFDQQ